MKVPVNGHPLPLLPALDRSHVAVEVCRDFLPRIQPVFGRSVKRRCPKGWLFHHSPKEMVPAHPEPGPNCSVPTPEWHGKTPHSTAIQGLSRDSAPYRLWTSPYVPDCLGAATEIEKQEFSHEKQDFPIDGRSDRNRAPGVMPRCSSSRSDV